MIRNSRPVSWIKAARKDFDDFPWDAQTAVARALTILAEGSMPDIAKPLTGLGSGRMEEAEMSDEDFDIVRGSGNLFSDLGHPDASREQLRSLLAAKIISVLDQRKLTVRQAHELTGIAAADFSRIRQVKLGRFTIDRLMTILARLGQEVEVTVKVHPSLASSGEVGSRL